MEGLRLLADVCRSGVLTSGLKPVFKNSEAPLCLRMIRQSGVGGVLNGGWKLILLP